MLVSASRGCTSQSQGDTPHTRVYPDATTLAELRARVKKKLFPFNGGTPLLSGATSGYQTLEWDTEIRRFLSANPDLYDNDEEVWLQVPQGTKAERDLYEPLVAIIDRVITYFDIADRAVLNTSRVYEQDGIESLEGSELRTDEEDLLDETPPLEIELKTAPDIIVVGRGGISFEDSNFPDAESPNYASCAVLGEVKLDNSKYKFVDHVVQLYVYTRQTFAAQQNRDYLYAVLITESQVRLFQFNRSLLVYSSALNYHKEPEEFVRLIVALLSADGHKLGFDTSIFLETVGDKRVRKMWLPLTQPGDVDGCATKVDVEGIRWRSKEIRGRGTTCWSVTYQNDRRLVKNLWRIKGRTPEWVFLQEVRKHDLKGVVCMLSYHEGLETALQHVSLVNVVFGDPQKAMDRIWCSLTFVEYGPTFEKFDSVLQLLYALYDAVNGHWSLWKIGILHRDISINNVLFGRNYCQLKDPVGPVTEIGNRGVLIDLDLAIWITRTESKRNDIRTGTRVFQSVKILQGGGWPPDYRDDLESFFNLLAWIALTYDTPGVPLPVASKVLAMWNDEDPQKCAGQKLLHMTKFNAFIAPGISKQLGEPIVKLLRSLCALLLDAPGERYLPCPETTKCVADLHPSDEVDAFYRQYLACIKTAIEEQTLEDTKNKAVVSIMDTQPVPDSSTPPPKTALPSKPTTVLPSAPLADGFIINGKDVHEDMVEVDIAKNLPLPPAPNTPPKRLERQGSSDGLAL